MSGRIPESFIQDLVARTDIVEVVGARLPLKKKGDNYWACCPFHGEKTPSFSVSQSKQFYKCFGCGVSGNALGFVMAHDRVEFPVAIEQLAERLGLEVPRDGAGADPLAEQRKELHALLAEVSLYYQRKLREPEGQPAVAYLKGRGVSGEVAKRYGIGFAPAGWDGVLKAIGTSSRARELLESAGMLVRKEQASEGREHYDRFRERVMFPIRDVRGRTIGFGGRVMGQGEPKYLNSPETPVFHKGFELYGLFEAKSEKASSERILLVEGYMDVVALAQYGIINAVAALGTAATEKHFESLFKYCPEVVCSFDGDKAGRAAGWRALQNALPMLRDGRQVRFLFLPDGEDPDSLVRKEGPEAFRTRMADTAIPLSTYLFRELESQTDMASPEGRARLASLAKPLIAKAADPVYRALLQQMLDEKVGLNRRPAAHSQATTPRMPMARPNKPQKPRVTSLVHQATGLLLQHPELVERVPMGFEIDILPLDRKGVMAQLISLLRIQPGVTTGQLLSMFGEPEVTEGLAKLAGWDHHVAADNLVTHFEDLLARLRRDARAADFNPDHSTQLAERIRSGLATPEEKARFAAQLKATR